MEEVWKAIQGFEHYEVSTHGRIRTGSLIMRPADNGLGYLQIKLWRDRKMTRKYVHRLVMETFSPCGDSKLEVNHIDHNKKNNHIENLEWVTHKENLRKAVQALGAARFTKAGAIY